MLIPPSKSQNLFIVKLFFGDGISISEICSKKFFLSLTFFILTIICKGLCKYDVSIERAGEGVRPMLTNDDKGGEGVS